MKVISILFCILLGFSCVDNTQDSNQKFVQIYTKNYLLSNDGRCPYQTIVVDSCEYLYVQNGNASWGSHKGNCKFCAERALKSKQGKK